MEIVNEEWKPIKDYEDYMISNLGNVKSLKNKKEVKLSLCADKFGYLHFNVYKNKKRKSLRVHRVVAETFILNSNNYKEINHINGNKTDNSIENLEWCTRSENIKHAYENNLKTAPVGELNKSCRKVGQYDLEGRLIKIWNRIKDIQEQLGFIDANIVMCCKGKYKTSNGYVWRYVDGK